MRRVLDEENRQNETWRDGRLERLFTRVERLEDGMGLSARMLTGQDRAFPGSTGGGMAFWDVQGNVLQLKAIVVSRACPGSHGPGWFLSSRLQVCVRLLAP